MDGRIYGCGWGLCFTSGVISFLLLQWTDTELKGRSGARAGIVEHVWAAQMVPSFVDSRNDAKTLFQRELSGNIGSIVIMTVDDPEVRRITYIPTESLILANPFDPPECLKCAKLFMFG